MIDFTNCKTTKKSYAGANGSKKQIIYNNEKYMLKFPPTPSINKKMSHTNGCISEYIGCHIFESVGIPVQETLLGIYNINGKEKIVVACKDFTSPGIELQDFASLKNQIIDLERHGYGTELSGILMSIDEQLSIDPISLSDRFWDMFIIDSLLGNWDRHNGNWGVLYNSNFDTLDLAPVYDCGSCLLPQADSEIMNLVLSDKNELNKRIYEFPTSAIFEDGKRIKPFDFISSLKNEDCNKALKRILPKINLANIYTIIDETPFLDNLSKTFYKTFITERKEKILDFSLKQLLNKEQNNQEYSER